MLELRKIDKYYNPGTVNEMCLFHQFDLKAVSYTHLDVYKRQIPEQFLRFPWMSSAEVSAVADVMIR